ncbi:thiamine phosphate synthase [Parabacteroides sp. AF17-28]|uniref:thiamine phosphate synthase n=1 Tax=Parabacteroides sp. AF17-28 TaxID=2292241 RepID=UPI000EFEDDEA|nr:thiamine phosphate synthase [Parabacteroides sp. AF17-28]RHR61279.1 thiamine phosphate synthase [Parabacteroides sp. AF17-28]
MKKLIVITTPGFFPGENIILTRLFEEGMQSLHLRKPEGKIDELRRLLDKIPTVHYPKIVLHDCFSLATDYGLGGVHLNRRNSLAPSGFKGTVSRSCHSIEEIRHYQSLDYLFLSPIFRSISKEGYGSGFAMETLQQASDAGIINEKVFALGGIDLATLPLLRPFRFGGAAVLGALWGERPSTDKQDIIITQYKKLQAWN